MVTVEISETRFVRSGPDEPTHFCSTTISAAWCYEMVREPMRLPSAFIESYHEQRTKASVELRVETEKSAMTS
jgi:hypothetical protein